MNRKLFLPIAVCIMLVSTIVCSTGQPTTRSVSQRIAASKSTAIPATATASPTDALPLECNDALGCVEIGPDEPITLAYMLTITGPTAFLGEDSLGGIEVAINERGEVFGHEVDLIGEDSGCSSSSGRTAATNVVANEFVTAVIGTNCSGAATAALPVISDAGLTMCSPSNTAPLLTDDGPNGVWQPGYFRASHNDLFQGVMAADFAYDILGARSAATIHDNTPYADQLQVVFADHFVELGGTITYQGDVHIGDADMRTVLSSAAVESPDVLYFPIFEPEGPFIIAQSSEFQGLQDTYLLGADGMMVQSFPGNAGSNADGMFLSAPYVSGSAYGDFLDKWADLIGGFPPSGFHAFAADCTNMLLDAIEASAQTDAEGNVLIGLQALRDAMSATTDFVGITGTLTCSSTGDCASGESLAMYEITNAEIENGNWPPEAVWTP